MNKNSKLVFSQKLDNVNDDIRVLAATSSDVLIMKLFRHKSNASDRIKIMHGKYRYTPSQEYLNHVQQINGWVFKSKN
jgi:hypothetical protein